MDHSSSEETLQGQNETEPSLSPSKKDGSENSGTKQPGWPLSRSSAIYGGNSLANTSGQETAGCLTSTLPGDDEVEDDEDDIATDNEINDFLWWCWSERYPPPPGGFISERHEIEHFMNSLQDWLN